MRLVGPLGRAATIWRRSIQARVVISTLLLSAVVVTLVGWLLMRQITDGLVAGKTDSAVADATRGAFEAQTRLAGAPGTEFDSSAQLAQLVAGIVARGDVQGYDVVLDGPLPGTGEGVTGGSGTRKSPDLDPASIPGRLRVMVTQTPGVSWTFTRIVYEPDTGQPSVPGIAAGSRITVPSDGGTYTLYYLFPMTDQAETLNLVRRALFTAGALLLLLVGGLTWLVTRQVVTPVRMAGDVLHDARARFDPVTARSAELLQKELDRFEMLLTDLLEISRFDAGAAVLDLEDVNLVDVAYRVAESTRPLAERRGTRVVVRDPGAPCVAEVDVRRVERIVRNLITNAVDYAEGRDIEIFVAAEGDATALAVRDHGVGLAPGEAAMVFNRFWRADPARARTTGGTGLGLAISLEDARLHGGWLQAWGELGRGAQFRLTLPRRAGDRASSSPLPLVPSDGSRSEVGSSYQRVDEPTAGAS